MSCLGMHKLLSVGDLKEEDEDEDDEDDDNEGDGDEGENEEEEDVEADSEKEEEAHLSALEHQRLGGKVGKHWTKLCLGSSPVTHKAKCSCSCIVSPEAPGGGRYRETGRQAATGPGGGK